MFKKMDLPETGYEFGRLLVLGHRDAERVITILERQQAGVSEKGKTEARLDIMEAYKHWAYMSDMCAKFKIAIRGDYYIHELECQARAFKRAVEEEIESRELGGE